MFSIPISFGTATRGVADVPVGGAGRMIANPTSVVFTEYHSGRSYTVSYVSFLQCVQCVMV